ncbi:MAG: molybdate ABC transporter permease subunit [Brevundimonas sp.]|uniref:molybdate ABC transporter permease subunit n=1 Tax=Brevundimonas sp. TaxID=1871086 RepID=UPI002724BCE5|nr:molybdate ABC transporter permease subunit [Brevundimonas sp.]MDO9075844.1 molybdate ABC transporter permease subunit [Brevundimonas sp.]MDP3081449.1 molybdate ABC transporter permease subunit [Brevundimonas sp.]MDZ4060017.1 molybdate ABC transporter permease subunit [Brevundimonas sp.]
MFTLSPEEQQIIGLSLKVAATATLFSLPPGVALAYLLSRYSFPGKALLSGLTHLPLILPPVVTGYALLLLFGRSGPLGRLLEPMGIVFAFDWTGAALAAAVMGFPLLVRAVRLSFDMVDPRIESAAETLGARPIVRFLTITLPLALPGVAAGTVLAFAKALGEFGATITFVASIPGETRTLPLAIYSLTQAPDSEAALLRLVLISVGVSIGALVLSEWGARSVARRVGGMR